MRNTRNKMTCFMRSALVIVSMLVLTGWLGCPFLEKEHTFTFVETNGVKLEIFCGAVRIGETGDIIPISRFGAGVTALQRQKNRDGTNDFFLFPEPETRLVFKQNGKEVKIAEEEWRCSSRMRHVLVTIRVVQDTH
jgi:hypothetical protein